MEDFKKGDNVKDTLNIELNEENKKLLIDNIQVLKDKGYLTKNGKVSAKGQDAIFKALKSLTTEEPIKDPELELEKEKYDFFNPEEIEQQDNS